MWITCLFGKQSGKDLEDSEPCGQCCDSAAAFTDLPERSCFWLEGNTIHSCHVRASLPYLDVCSYEVYTAVANCLSSNGARCVGGCWRHDELYMVF